MAFNPQDDSRYGPFIGVLVRVLILYSLVMFMVEIDWGNAENSREGNPFWLWNERIVATLFTIEYLGRIWIAKGRRVAYMTSGFGIIDLLAVMPFWVGFFLPANPSIYLRVVRSCRILRMLKYVRYLHRVQMLLRALISTWNELLAIGFLCSIVFFFGSVLIFEIERYSQPEKYGTLGNSLWYMAVTLTTVGYGDVSPVTSAGKLVMVVIMIMGLGLVTGFVGIISNTVYSALNPTHDMEDDLKRYFSDGEIKIPNAKAA